MEVSRPEYWIVSAFPSPGDLPKPEIKSASPALVGRLFTTERPGLPFLNDCTVYTTSGTETVYHRLGLEPTCWDSNPAKTHGTWFQDLMKLRFLMSHCRKKSVRDKVIGNKWIYSDLERCILYRQSVGHCRGQVQP